MSLRREDFPVIAAAREQLGVPENAEATPAQTLELLRIVPQDLAERMITAWREQAGRGVECWIRDHQNQIDYWRDRALAANGDDA